jgi:hypothetical protein
VLRSDRIPYDENIAAFDRGTPMGRRVGRVTPMGSFLALRAEPALYSLTHLLPLYSA